MMSTGFGWIEIGGRRYGYDVVIRADGSVTRRSKKLSRDLKTSYGHTPLSEEELDILETDHPEVVYIGTGQSGSLPVTPGARELLRGYETVILTTPELIARLDQESRRYVAVIHVTC